MVLAEKPVARGGALKRAMCPRTSFQLTFWLALALPSFACSSRLPPHAPERPAAVGPPAARTTTPALVAPSPGAGAAPDWPVELAVLLTDADLVALSLTEDLDHDTCRGLAAPLWVVSGTAASGEAVSCLATGHEVVCSKFAGHDLRHVAEVLCGEATSPAPAPSWVRAMVDLAIATGASLRVAPVPGPSGSSALSLGMDHEHAECAIYCFYLLVRRERWIASTAPVEQTSTRGGLSRVLDASGIPGGPWVAVVTSAYDGGSEMGEEWSRLVLLSGSGERMVERGDKLIGDFVWHLAGPDRHRYPKGAHSLDARPHLEVTLVPTIGADGIIELAPGRIHMPRQRVRRWTCAPGDDEECPVDSLRALEREAGRWRFDGTAFRRVTP